MQFRLLPVSVLLLVAGTCHAAISPRALANRAHQSAVRHTKRFAKDLRIALRSVLVDSEDTTRVSNIGKRAVYCTINTKSISAGTDTNNATQPASSTASSSSSATNSTSSTGTQTFKASAAHPTATSTSPWKLLESHSGSDFFDGWQFFTNPDPTNGIVQYTDQATAQSNNLISINDKGNAIMRVETTATVETLRKSVRIQTATTFTGGLVILDAVHMPTGCGTWPAFWTNGPNWPTTGEIDIVEGVGDYTNVQATIHTSPGCTLSSSDLGMSGTLTAGISCDVGSTGNQGCGVRAKETNSYGAGFNSNNGGVFAMKWDTSGISVYFFPRGSIPGDITAGAPVPSKWGQPVANWPASGCDPFKYFNTHAVIFDTTLCGDWASGVWNGAGIPGQETSCATRTGFPTCEAFVRANGGSLSEAYWEVNNVQIYQLK